jgi:hypothetical protein
MPKIPTITYETWEEFKADVVRELFGEGVFRSGRFLFRGHCSANWSLESSFDRAFPDLPGTQRQAVADQLAQDFSGQCRTRNLLPFKSDEYARIMAYAQHYGLPTRLLDWTESPYIAAFFALSDVITLNEQCQFSCIWILDTHSGVWGSGMRVEIVAPPSEGNDRLRNQLGRFTINWSQYASVENYVEDSAASDEPLRKMLLPTREAFKAVADLDAMGINYANLFPGIEGCVRSARLRLMVSLHED